MVNLHYIVIYYYRVFVPKNKKYLHLYLHKYIQLYSIIIS